MSDNKTTLNDRDLSFARMNDLARQIGEMEPEDPNRAVRLKELYTLRELSKSFETERNKNIEKAEKTAKANYEPTPVDQVSMRMPLCEYDEFVKAVDASSRAAVILKNACYHREMRNGKFERFMEIACTEEELKILLSLANRYCPAAASYLKTV